MKFCINCDHPDLCHDLALKICYRTDAHRCQCVQYTEAPEQQPETQMPPMIDQTQLPHIDMHQMNDIMLGIIKNMNTGQKLTE